MHRPGKQKYIVSSCKQAPLHIFVGFFAKGEPVAFNLVTSHSACADKERYILTITTVFKIVEFQLFPSTLTLNTNTLSVLFAYV